MNHLRKALIDTIILGGLFLIIATSQKTEPITRAIIPIATVACYNFIKAAFKINAEKKKPI